MSTEHDEPVFHLRQYGDVTAAQLEEYARTGKIGGGMDQSTELDIYGMSPEVRAEFEAWFRDTFADEPDYAYAYDQFRAATWAACAKLYRGKLRDVEQRVKQLEAEAMK